MTHGFTALRTGLLALSLLLLTSCKIGNESGSCETGETCVCDLIGNCTKTCPDGGCHFVCEGTSNCIFDCEGGGCDMVCKNTGNSILTCEGGGCTATPQGNTGNCILKGALDLSVPPDLKTSQDLASHD